MKRLVQEKAAPSPGAEKGDASTPLVVNMISYLDTELRYEFVSASYETVFGLKSEDIVGRPVRELVGEDRYKPIAGHLERARSGETVTFSAHVPDATGNLRNFEVTLIPDRSPGGAVRGILLLGNDLSRIRAAEITAQRSQADWRAILDAIPDLVFRFDAEERFTYYQGGRESELYVAPEKFVGKTPAEVLPAPVGVAVEQKLREAKAKREIVTFDYQLPMPAGMHWYTARISPLADGGTVCVVRDVTQEHRAREALEMKNALLDAIVQNIPSGLFLKDARDSFRATSWNESARRIMRRPELDFESKTASSYFSPALAEEATADDRRVIETGEPNTRIGRRIPAADPARSLVVNVRKVPILKDEQGYRHVLVIADDVTEATRLREELERAHGELRQFFELAPDLLCILGREIERVNPCFAETFGRPAAELRGRALDELVHPDDRETVRAALASLCVERPSATFETRLPSAAGPNRVVQWNASRDPSLGLVYVGGRDVTEQLRQAHALEEEKLKTQHHSRMALVGELAAGVAHEINNPLAIICGAAGTLSRHASDPEKLNAKIEQILRAAERASRIVSSLTRFSHGDESERELVSLDAIARDAIELLGPTIARLQVHVELESKGKPLIHASRIEIEQVIVSLLNNAFDAVKHQDTRWVRIHVDGTGPGASLCIHDSGPGVAPGLEEKIFVPFFTTKPVGEGAGLGLSEARGILESHGGSVALVKEEKHTCFQVCFPRAL